MLEKRKLKRRHPIYYLKVHDRTSNCMIGRIIDIHTEGMRLVSEKPLDPNQQFNLRIDLPRAVDGGEFIDLEARAVWCDLDKNPDFYDTGFTFTRINYRDREIIDTAFIDYVFSY